ncbi:hypothetical protein THRCLA_06429 [Thraustotheca clavata]|uniref:Protein Lines N-terminal domain-containing protein n=1 Tax=Thraustotheca clavata TaxID=74557 RepID=A0A1V9ZNU5_9STRA|nr:hypothetical protein THRCLA_06429 [Thraustotheca clavata]
MDKLLGTNSTEAFAALKSLEKSTQFTTESDVQEWLSNILIEPICGALGYQFQLIRSLLDQDDQNNQMQLWILQTLPSKNDLFYDWCDRLKEIANIASSFAYEFVCFLRSVYVHYEQDAEKMSVQMLPLIFDKSIPQAIQVEIVAWLDDILGQLDVTHEESRAFLDVLAGHFALMFPFFIQTALATNSDVGADFFIGESTAPFVQHYLLLGLHLLQSITMVDGWKPAPTTQEQIEIWSNYIRSPELDFEHLRTHLLQIVCEEDDFLVSVLYKALVVYTNLRLVDFVGDPLPLTTDSLSPPSLFDYFCHVIHDDHSVLIDFLTSDETEALTYFVAFLRYLQKEWLSCTTQWKNENRYDAIIKLLQACRDELCRFDQQKIIRFDITPLLRRLDFVLSLTTAE